MNAPLKILGLGTAALLLASAAANASTVTVSDTINDADVLTLLTVEVDSPAPDVGGAPLTGIAWSFTLDSTGNFALTNTAGFNQSYTIREIGYTLERQSHDPEFLPQSTFISVFSGTISGTVNAGSTVDIGPYPGEFDFGETVVSGDFPDWIAADFDGNGNVGAHFVLFPTLTGTFGTLTLVDNSEIDVTFDATYTYIPLPAAAWLLLSGVATLGGLGWMRRRAV